MTIADVAKQAYRRRRRAARPSSASGLEATVRFRPTRFPTWSNATHICVVEIDAETVAARGEALHRVRGLRHDDQPDGRRGPDRRRRGAGHRRRAARGLRVRRRRATRSPRTFMDYLLPTDHRGARHRDRPHRDRVDHQPRRVTRAWARAAPSASHAAVANAVADALAHLGVKATKTPLGPEQIFALVEAAKASA